MCASLLYPWFPALPTLPSPRSGVQGQQSGGLCQAQLWAQANPWSVQAPVSVQRQGPRLSQPQSV